MIDKTDPAVSANIDALLKVLDPADNATGGGTASAAAGAMAAALAAMVGRLSIGKDGMEGEAFYAEIVDEGERLARELFDGCRADSEAFEAVRAAFKLPKDSDQQAATRRRAIQAAWVGAGRIPLANARLCKRVAELAGRLEGKSNPEAASDLITAAALARAGLRGCIANVRINMPAIEDRVVVEELMRCVEALEEAIAT